MAQLIESETSLERSEEIPSWLKRRIEASDGGVEDYLQRRIKQKENDRLCTVLYNQEDQLVENNLNSALTKQIVSRLVGWRSVLTGIAQKSPH